MPRLKTKFKIKIKIFSLATLLLLSNLANVSLAAASVPISETEAAVVSQDLAEPALVLPLPEKIKEPIIDPDPKPDLLVVDPDESVVESKPDSEEMQILTEDPEPNFDRGENKISLEKLNLKTDGNSGALLYNFPLTIPQGRNGLQPKLALSYNNQDTEKLNQFGSGWFLNIPSIKRINKNGSDNLYAESFFNSSLSGELKLVNSTDGLHGEYQAEVENGDFLKYELTSNNYWQVTDKTGTVYTFGFTTSSRQDNPSDQSQIYQWLISETRDTNDNYIKYEYFKDAGQIYPDTITYTGNGETDGIFYIEFLRESRTDNLEANNTGFSVVNNYRISEIDISINNSWVKKYEFDYTTGNNGQSSYLDTILESAKDESNNIFSLPINDFDYQETVKSFTLDENYEFPLIFVHDSGDTEYDQGVRLVDVNGDNFVDAIRGYYRVYYLEGQQYILDYKDVYINDGNGHWGLDETYNFPYYFLKNNIYDQGVRLEDVNGDALVDVIRSFHLNSENDFKEVYINNGHGWDLDENYELPVYFITDSRDRGVRLADVNGDGIVDIIKGYYFFNGYQDPSIYNDVYLNNGDGNWILNEEYNFPLYFITQSWGTDRDEGVELADVNGDGLVDVLQSVYGWNGVAEYIVKGVYINDGNGDWYLDENYDIPLYFIKYDYGVVKKQGVRLMDINNDHLVDIVRAFGFTGGNYREVYINNGHEWSLDENYELPPLDFYSSRSGEKGVQLGDVDGNDRSNFVQGLHWSNSQGEYDEQKVYINNAQIESLSTIKNSQGAEINISYQPSTQYKDQSGNLLNPDLPFVVQTVKQITINDGLDNESTIDYQYSNGQYYYNNPEQRKVAGFGQVEKIIDDTKTITYYHQGNDSNSSQGEYQDSYSKIGRPYRSETYDNNSNTLLSQELYKWEETDLGHDNSFVYNTLKSSTDFSNSTKSTAIEYQYSTSTGNLLVENNLGTVTINTGTGEITSQLAGDEKVTDYDYAENTNKHILAAPKNKEISNTIESKDQDLYYDNLPLGQVEKVNLTKEDYKVDTVKVQRTFNNYGLVATETDPKNATTTISYDSANMYPSSSTNSLNQVTYTQYNLLNGQVATSTAPNGALTINNFDAFGRLTKVQISDHNNPSALVTKQEISYQDTTLPRYKESKDYFNTNSYVTAREYYDGLDRVIQKKSSLASQNEFATIDISYDLQGRVARESLPYISSVLAYTSADLSKPAKTYTYDALGRVLTEVTPVGTTTYQYDGFTTKIFDANNHRKDLTKDAYGNLIEVKEYNGASVYATTYEYTLTNKLKKITDSAGNIRNFSYDALDNLVWQDMVHTTSTQNPAKIQYTYDKNGNVLTETSFKNDAISYTYDDLNRPLLEKLSGNTKISYTYDQNGDIGQLTFVNYGAGNSKAYDYDILGRLKIATTTIEDEAFVMNYDYDLNGNLKEIVYPDNKVVTYGFNNIGQVDEVSLNQSQGAVILADNIQYNQNGQMVHVERANGITTDYTYDPAQAFRLTRILSTQASSTLQDLNYTYDPVGNILTLVDDANTDLKKQAIYTYDDLNRLLLATVSYPNHQDKNYTQTFSYDSIGNMTANSDLGTLNYTNSQPHQLSSYGARTFLYDNAGNMTRNGGINKFSWDYRNRLSVSNDIASNNNTYYLYDHNNQRFLKYTEDYVYIPPIPQEQMMMRSESRGGEEQMSGGSGHWEWQRIAQDKYIDKYFEKDIASNTKAHIFLNDIKIATVNNNDNPYYILGDHLNSSSILTNNTGTTAQLSDYKPFGSINYDNKLVDLKNDYKFTGKEKDEESELQYFGARYMDNQTGHFVSVDPATLAFGDIKQFKNSYGVTLQEYLADPQNLNSYTYGRNNPIILVDPDGQSWQTFGQGVVSSFTYAYNHPLQTIGAVALGTAAVMAAPVVAAVGGAALGGYAIGNALGNAYIATDSDTRDYYLGQGTTATAFTVLGIKGASNLSTSENIANEAKVLNDQAFSKAASHADTRGHYPNLSVSEIENVARNTRANADIKVNMSGPNAKQYYYDQSNNNLFINNPKQPSIFQPNQGLQYLRNAIGDDLRRGNIFKR